MDTEPYWITHYNNTSISDQVGMPNYKATLLPFRRSKWCHSKIQNTHRPIYLASAAFLADADIGNLSTSHLSNLKLFLRLHNSLKKCFNWLFSCIVEYQKKNLESFWLVWVEIIKGHNFLHIMVWSNVF